MKLLQKFGLFIGALACAASAFASMDTSTPDVLVKNVTEEVLTIVRQDKDLQNGNTKKAVALVETKVLPHFNFTRMTGLALGRDWNKATPDQKRVLTQEFRTLLVRTYSNALTAYRDQTVEYKPFKMAPGDTDVTVRTQVNQKRGKPIQLDYVLEKEADGWKVYDVVVAGVSLVTNYRSSFSQEVHSNGMDGLIKMLQAKNKALDSGNGKK